jgi:hypothetical protein
MISLKTTLDILEKAEILKKEDNIEKNKNKKKK